MSKQSLLLVDGDTRSLRVLEVSLRKAGFTVTTAETVQDALEKLEVHLPELIVSETTFTDGDGFELRRRVRATPDWGDIPFIFLTAEQAIENKIRGLELGVDDYLTKPIYIKEIITRINILLQKRQRARFEERRDGRTRFAGRISDMPVIDVIQTIEVSRKSGVIQFIGERSKSATIYFRDGKVIDAEAGALQGEDAVYRLLTWSEGEFEVVFRTVRRREVIQTSSQGLLMEGMRRLDEWSRILEQLPPLSHRFEIDTTELAARLGDVPDDNNRILRLIDGRRTLFEVIDACDVGDLECLQTIARLYFEEIMLDLDHGAGLPRRDSGRHIASSGDAAAPTPIEEVASGPVTAAHLDDVEAEARAAKARDVREARWEREAKEARALAAAATALPLARTVKDPRGLSGSSGADGEAAKDSSGPTPAETVEDTQPTDLADVLSEEDAPNEPGPLMGGFRPSSLRLIDEAVAAAQAIEPSLFAGVNDLDDAPTDAAVPHAIEGDESSSPAPSLTTKPAAQPRVPRTLPELPPLTTDESGLRMIGSLGRDRAEASGELRRSALIAALPIPAPETQRELITILPRRATREIPIMSEPIAPIGAPSGAPIGAPISAAIEPPVTSPTSVVARDTSVAATSVARDNGVAAPRVVGPGTATPVLEGKREQRELRELRTPVSVPVQTGRSGPGPGALLLIGIAVVLTVVAVYLKIRKARVEKVPTALADAGIPAVTPPGPDALVAGSTDAGVARPDAASVVDAGVADARVVDASVGVDAGVVVDRIKQAKLLHDEASTSFNAKQYVDALEQINRALALHKNKRSYLLKAGILDGLGKIDESAAAYDAAIEFMPDDANSWALKGWMLWKAGRKAAAKEAFGPYLDLMPDGAQSNKIRALFPGSR